MKRLLLLGLILATTFIASYAQPRGSTVGRLLFYRTSDSTWVTPSGVKYDSTRWGPGVMLRCFTYNPTDSSWEPVPYPDTTTTVRYADSSIYAGSAASASNLIRRFTNSSGATVYKGWYVNAATDSTLTAGGEKFSTELSYLTVLGVVYDDSIKAGSTGNILMNGVGYAAFKKDRTDSARIGKQITVLSDTLGKFDVDDAGFCFGTCIGGPKLTNAIGDTLIKCRIFELIIIGF